MSEIGQRIEAIMNDNNLNYRSLGIEVGYSDVAVRNIVLGKSNPKFDLLHALIKKYPKINSYWLLTGIGEMYSEVKGHSLSDASINEVAEFVVANQKKFLDNLLFNEFVEKMAAQRAWALLNNLKNEAG